MGNKYWKKLSSELVVILQVAWLLCMFNMWCNLPRIMAVLMISDTEKMWVLIFVLTTKIRVLQYKKISTLKVCYLVAEMVYRYGRVICCEMWGCHSSDCKGPSGMWHCVVWEWHNGGRILSNDSTVLQNCAMSHSRRHQSSHNTMFVLSFGWKQKKWSPNVGTLNQNFVLRICVCVHMCVCTHACTLSYVCPHSC
jgi:hypothetical protein